MINKLISWLKTFGYYYPELGEKHSLNKFDKNIFIMNFGFIILIIAFFIGLLSASIYKILQLFDK